MAAACFQSFDDPRDGAASRPRLALLREELARRGLDGFIVPHADRHQSEYLPPADERLAWLTGFTGSAGAAVVLSDRAAIFVDGRYTLQVREQVDTGLFEVVHFADKPPHAWLQDHLPAGARFGFDPWLHTGESAEKLARVCAACQATLVPADPNPIDAVWSDRPAPPLGPVALHDVAFAGEPATKKIERIRGEIAKLKADALVVSDPPAIAWTFNIRGRDVAHTPVALAYAIVTREELPRLYIDHRKVGDDVRDALAAVCTLRDPEDFVSDLQSFGAAKRTLRLDQASAAEAISTIVQAAGGRAIRGPDPIAALKAIKNATEIAGARSAHRRDGAAVTRFLAWLDREAPAGTLTEIDAVIALENFRRDTGVLKDISFATIAGSGPNGAVVHYRVTRRSNRRLGAGELFLIDSGAQYVDGTTDVTRTVAIGEPSEEMRDRFTRVLKGHVAIARAVFPQGTTGAQIDSLARLSLWAAGLDFDHGTGHGVGSYLSVHEGPARISKLGTVALQRGMILSNEPGYYKFGEYGIRLENLVLVMAAPPVAGAEKSLDAFETLTLAPFDRRLILLPLMTREEIGWVDAYHARVREELSPLIDAGTRGWLEAATRPLVAPAAPIS